MNTLESPPVEQTKPVEQIADTLSQFLSFRDKLQAEKADLLKRVAKIDHALGLNGTAPKTSGPKQSRNPVSKRLTLPEALAKVLAGKELTRPEIVRALKKAGWRTTSKKPIELLNYLYTPEGKEKFRQTTDGRFTLK